MGEIRARPNDRAGLRTEKSVRDSRRTTGRPAPPDRGQAIRRTAQEGEGGRTARGEGLRVVVQDGEFRPLIPIIPGVAVRSMTQNPPNRVVLHTRPRFRRHDRESLSGLRSFADALTEQLVSRPLPPVSGTPADSVAGFIDRPPAPVTRFRPNTLWCRRLSCGRRGPGGSVDRGRSRGRYRLPGFSPTGKRPITAYCR